MSLYSQFIKQPKFAIKFAGTLGAFLIFAGLFGALADEVRDGDTGTIDTQILLSINNTSTPLLDAIFSFGTNLASISVIACITLFLVVALVYRRMYSKAVLLVAIVGGAGLANIVAKLSFARPRPELWQRIVEETTYSFPSGHAMGSMALAFAVVLIAWNTKWRIASFVLATAYVAFIGFSRLYLGVHYPSDVLAGWMLAVAWGTIVMGLFDIHLTLRRKQIPKRHSKA